MIVREDSQTLYGFADADARDLFLTLLGVSGVGPKIALATLAVYDATALRQALADGDVTALTRVPGIGKRGAERMVLELRDKIGPVATSAGVAVASRARRARTGRGSPCRTWLCGQAGRGGLRQGAGRRSRGHHVECAAGGAVAAREDQVMGRFENDDERATVERDVIRRTDGRRRRHRRQPATAVAGRVHRPAAGARAAAAGARGRQEPRRHTGSHPAVRSARARQDVAGDDHRRRTGHLAAGDVGPRAGAGRRPGCDAVQPRRARRVVHRRDPPHRPARRGDAVSGDGGLPGRRRGRAKALGRRRFRWRSRRSPWSGRPPGRVR